MFFDRLPEVISSYGKDIDDLIFYIYYITGFFFVALQAYLVYIVIRYRKKPGVAASPDKGKSKVEIYTLLVADVILLILDFTIGYRGVVDFFRLKDVMPEKPAVTVRAVGQQFSWVFIYPGNDGMLDTPDDVVSISELRLPVNEQVQINLRGKDVLHSLFLPNARFKQDLIPGREIPTWVELNKTGEYEIICAELCGSGHTAMKGKLISMTADEFNAWQKSESTKAEEGNS